jgi:hypothetical protein
MNTTEEQMNNEMIRAAVAMALFGTILLGLGCGGANENSNTVTSDKELEACKDTTSNKPTKIDDEIKNGLSTKLKGQLMDTANPNGSFKFKTYVRQGPQGTPDFLELYVEGTILGKDEFHDFSKLVKKSLKKDGSCVRNVYFVLPGTTPPPQPSMKSLVNPESSYCEWPNRPCSDGSCGC